MENVQVMTTPFAQAGSLRVNLHLDTTLQVSAEEARRLVNREVVTRLGTGLVARHPELLVNGETLTWRVPVVLSLPGLGDLGQVGAIKVDAQTGRLLSNTAVQEGIVQHARRLYEENHK